MTLWGSGSPASEQEIDNFSDIAIRWKVEGRTQTFEYANITDARFVHETYSYKGVLGRITPAGENYFYYQCGSGSEYNNTIVPALYRFDAENNTCTMLGNVSEIEGVALQKCAHNIIGVSQFDISGHEFIAFGSPSDNGSTLTVVKNSDTDDNRFKDATKLWTINDAGFSYNPLQGCDMKYIQSPATVFNEASEPQKQLLAYIPNGGMALYNVILDSTTGINDVYVDNKPLISGQTLFTGADNVGCQIFDIAGRCVAVTEGSSVDLSLLPSGVYIVRIAGETKSHKIAL